MLKFTSTFSNLRTSLRHDGIMKVFPDGRDLVIAVDAPAGTVALSLERVQALQSTLTMYLKEQVK